MAGSVQTSIIVVTYNSRADIDACLRSLRAHSGDVEIIVVDNLSIDGTLEHVRHSFPDVLAVSAERNGGYGAGVNLGVSLARGAYLAVLNPDTEVQAGWLAPLIAALDEHGSGLATPTILLKGTADRVNACGNDVHLTGLAFCARLKQTAPAMSEPPRPVAAVSGAAFVVRRDVWARLGGFDERFFMYLEDTDLSLRARRLGYEIVHVPASRIWHTYTVRVSAEKLYHLEHNRLLMLCKNLSPATLLALLPALVLTETLIWTYCARQGRAYMAAKWRSYRRLWMERHAKRGGTISRGSRQADRLLLRSLSPRLALEQLSSSIGAAPANVALTAFYSLWRRATTMSGL